jgi:hypothetical protein
LLQGRLARREVVMQQREMVLTSPSDAGGGWLL